MPKEKLVIDDLVVLGNAVPDELRDFRKAVCTVAYSSKHGLIRIYPVPPRSHMKRWNIVKVEVEKNPQDTRIESWKLQGSKDEWPILASKIEKHGTLNRKKQILLLDEIFSKHGFNCVNDLNNKKKSLGLISPKEFEPRFEQRKKHESTVQTELFEKDIFLTIHNYDVQPRIKYRCSDCISINPHDQQLLEWGVYEWIRQHPDRMDDVWKNLHIGDTNYDTKFLVGNMNLRRNSFMIISIFRFKQTD